MNTPREDGLSGVFRLKSVSLTELGLDFFILTFLNVHVGTDLCEKFSLKIMKMYGSQLEFNVAQG